MADALKTLGQVAPAATTDTTLYTVAAATSAVVSSLVVCNRDPAATTFRVAVRPLGATLANQHYNYYDAPLGGNATFVATIGITLATTDVVTVRSASGLVSFSLYGTEVT